MISIVVPLYNKSKYILKSLESILNQTFQDFEIIVIDDGSTDDSLNIVKSIKSNKIIIFEQENSGVSVARNKGVEFSKFEYIAFLDADDWWVPTFLEEMAVLINKYPEAGLFASSYFKIKNNLKIQAQINVENNFTDGYIDYIKLYSEGIWMPIWTGATIIKKDVFNELYGFKTNLKLGEDFDLWLRSCLKYPIVFLNKPLSNYNQDVDQQNRAIGLKFYKPEEHVLFQDFGELSRNPDFIILFEKLFLYGMFPYYVFKKNQDEIKLILKTIRWENHPIKYKVLYKYLPIFILKVWFNMINILFQLKSKI